MSIEAFSISGYRSIREIYLPLQKVNLIVGANGAGKTNLYRALYLLHRAASGTLALAITEEGGMPSVLWAGARRKGPVRVCIAIRLETHSYSLECGLPTPYSETIFKLDPVVREEKIFLHEGNRKTQILGRSNAGIWARDDHGNRAEYLQPVAESESILGEIREPHRFPEISMFRQALLSWRFYHHFRTDIDSPIRQPQIGTMSPVLSHDGSNLAAAIATIYEIGDPETFKSLLEQAFPGCRVEVSGEPRLDLQMWYPGFPRPFAVKELSDGTLQYLCLLTALMSPRPPTLLAMNEPETSIHSDLLPSLANLIFQASRRSQIWVTTHSTVLADSISKLSGSSPIRVEKIEGETRVAGQSDLERSLSI